MGTDRHQRGWHADEKIIDKFVVELKRYYGEPYDADEVEDSCSWHWKNGQFIRARHLHADEGGWTVFMYTNNF